MNAEVSSISSSPLYSWKALAARNKAGAFLVSTMVCASVVLYALCAINVFKFVHKPFPGFLVNERVAVSLIGQYQWTGSQAGLRYPDKILKANGVAIDSPPRLQAIVDAAGIGTPIRYVVERNGRPLEISVNTMRFSWTDLYLTFGFGLLAAVIYLTIGLIVLILKPQTKVSWLFFCACFLLSLYHATVVAASAHLFVRVYLLVAAFVPAVFVHFALYFPTVSPLADRHPWIQVLPYSLSSVLALSIEYLYPQEAFLPFWNAVLVYLVFAAAAVLVPVLAAYWRPISVLARQRAKVVLFGMAVAFPLPTLAFLFQSLYGSFGGIRVETNYLAPLLMTFPASVAYAIARHNLFDVDVYIKRALGYGLMTAIVGFAYFSVQTLASTFVLKPAFGVQAEKLYPILFALLVVFFFNPVNQRVQAGVERLFFRKAYDYKATVETVSHALTGMLDLTSFLQKIIKILKTDLFVDRAAVILLDNRQNAGTILFRDAVDSAEEPNPDPRLSGDDPLFALLSGERKLITKYDIQEGPQYEAVRTECGRSFSRLGATLALPLFHGDAFTGILALGYKKSGQFYSREDIDLLKTLSSMTSTAIEQTREKDQRATLMQLFSKHVSPQVAEVLWQQRDQFLDGGRPRAQKQIVTVMFTDLQGFTGVSEKLEPQALMTWLNTYMEAIAKTVMEHGGVVDDYFGDGVKVNFGVPIPRSTEIEVQQDAVSAVTCAVALERQMRLVNTIMREQGLPTLKMRVGIFTGPVVAGSLGSADRMKYTTLGDTVNTAARLESYDKDLSLLHLNDSPCRILIGQETLRLIGGEFETMEVGELTLKGKETKIRVHSVVPSGSKSASPLGRLPQKAVPT